MATLRRIPLEFSRRTTWFGLPFLKGIVAQRLIQASDSWRTMIHNQSPLSNTLLALGRSRREPWGEHFRVISLTAIKKSF
jgi:hypothetical protein